MSELLEEEVPEALDGERLDRIVSLMADISRSDAARTIAAGAVSIDGVVAMSGKERLKVGRHIAIDLDGLPRLEPPRPDPTIEVDVVYCDEDVIVVDKAAGLVVHPGAGHDSGTLVNGLLARFPEIADVGESFRPGIVHRLDMGTSGLMVVARNSTSHGALTDMIADHAVRRVYKALVWGDPEFDSMTIDAPIGRDARDVQRMTVVTTGKPARTHVEVEERFLEPETAFVTCELETGRTHQIRVHLRAVGHPVVGDSAYGGAKPGITLARPFLHAERLEFDHPRSGEHLCFVSPLPEDLKRVLDQCRSSS